ncbi:MAG TPA: tetratricopeptide repeat protein [Methylomirabilota bacterium]|nr:tetratricopeptide repeat protein [Methylomirabilota bacterium]
MSAVLRDAYGLSVSTASRPALDAYDRGVNALLGFGADATERFREALRLDPDFALARAALAVSLYLDEQIPEGRAEMDRAGAAAPALPPRERRHVEALALWVGGRGDEAIPVIREILAEEPREVVLIHRLYFIYFWQGRAAEMLELTGSVVDAFDGDSYVLGMHAFSLEENRRFEEALPLAERAVAMNPKDAWAVHAVAHVLYERGENDRGVDALPPRIHPCDHLGYFRNHLLWHLALMHLAEGRYDRVSRLFESVFGRIPITVAGDLQDSVALAWRLDLFGHPDSRRWRQLGVAARRWLDLPLLLFHDLHVGMALAASGDWPTAELQLGRMQERVRKTRNRTLPEVVVPLLEGLHAFARGDHAGAAARIAPIEDRIVEVGGSNAQREVFHDTLLAATLRAGMHERAQPLLERRLAKRPNPGRYWSEARLGAPAGGDGKARG